MLLFNDDMNWIMVSAADHKAFDIFSRHYTFRKWRNRKGKNGKRFTGPGEQMTLVSKSGDALFVWRKEKFRRDTQNGICCAVFRNESNIKSSSLIIEAENVAWSRWPSERLFTFVDETKIKSTNPGYCFIKAGWKKAGKTKAKKLIILEKYNK